MRRTLIPICTAIAVVPHVAIAEWVELGTWPTDVEIASIPLDWRIDTESIRREGTVISYTVEQSMTDYTDISNYTADCARQEILAVYDWDYYNQEWVQDPYLNEYLNSLWEEEPAHAEICRQYW